MKVAEYKFWTVISVELAAVVCISMFSVFVRGELSEQGACEQELSGDIGRRTLQSRRLQSSVNKTIYSGSRGYDTSWSGRANNADVSYYKPGADQPEQMCMTFQATGAWMAFNCPNCTTPPFALNTTAGLAYSITSYQVNGTDADVGVIMAFPYIVHVMLMDSNFNVLCPADLLHSMAAQGPMQSAKTLFQNYPSNNGRPDCRQAYNTAEYIGFQSWQGSVSMCLNNLKLLPSAVVPQETAAAVPPTPPLMNCWDRDVQPVDQNGNYTVQALPDFLLSNITRLTTANSFTVFPRVDIPYGRYFRAVNDSCSVIVAPNVTAVGQCSQTAAWGYGIFGTDGHGDACCFDTTNYTVCYISPR